MSLHQQAAGKLGGDVAATALVKAPASISKKEALLKKLRLKFEAASSNQ